MKTLVFFVITSSFLLSCTPYTEKSKTEGNVFLDTLGILITEKEVKTPGESLPLHYERMLIYKGKEFSLPGHYKTRELVSTTVRYKCKFSEQKCCVVGSYLFLTDWEHCCYGVTIYDLNSPTLDVVKNFSGNDPFCFVDVDNNTLVYHEHIVLGDDIKIGLAELQFFKIPLDDLDKADTVSIFDSWRLSAADFDYSDAQLDTILARLNMECKK